MIMRILVVIVCYNRLNSFKRLADSLESVRVDGDIICDLLISIDNSEAQKSMYDIGASMTWIWGKKKIVCRSERLGLKKHVLVCGDEVYNYDILLMLEDDLYVSSEIIKYVVNAFKYIDEMAGSEKISGVSTYAYRINETSLKGFCGINLYDNYFLQLPCSWGQAWNKNMWDGFKRWYENETYYEYNILPSNIQRWSEKSWKKLYVLYMVKNDKYFFYPVYSYSTNCGDSGEHMRQDGTFRVLLDKRYSEKKYGDLLVAPIYDAWMDIVPDFLKVYNKKLKGYDFVVNISGDKKINEDIYQVSLIARRHIEMTWGKCLLPLEENIVKNVAGYDLYLTKGKRLNIIKSLYGEIVLYLPDSFFRKLFGGIRRIMRNIF